MALAGQDPGHATQTAQPAKKLKVKANPGAKKAAQRYMAAQEQGESKALTAAKAKVDPYRPEVNAETKLQYGGQTNALNQQQANLPTWYNDYRAQVAAIQARQQGFYQGLNAQNQANAQQLAASAQQTIQSAGQQQAQGAQVTGATPNQQVLTDAANAANVRQQMAGNYGGLLQAQGGAEDSYLTNVGAASYGQQQAANQSLASQQDQLAAQKGAFKVKSRNDLIAADAAAAQQVRHDNIALQIASGNQAVSAGNNRRTNQAGVKKTLIGSKTSRANNQATNAAGVTKAQIQAQAQKQKQAANQQAATQKQKQAARQGSRKEASRLDDLAGRYTDYANHTNVVNGKPIKPTPFQVRTQLRKDGFSSQEINLAIKRANGQRFTPHDVAEAKRLGFIVPKHLRPVKVSTGTKGHNQAVNNSPGSDQAQG